MTSSPATPIVGSNVTFTITVTNSGPNDATNVVVNDFLPAGLTYVSNDGGASNSGGTVTWTLPTLATGATATINIVATVNPSGSRVNSAEVWSSNQVDPDSIAGNSSGTEDDEASVTVTPPVTTGLSITNIVNNPTPNVGSNVVFTITVSNFSTTGATNVRVNTTFPSGLVFVSSAPVTAAGDLNIGNLNSGASVTFIVTANVSSSGTKNFQATVTSNEFADATDPETVNPIASTEADLSLSQTWNSSTTASGQGRLEDHSHQ